MKPFCKKRNNKRRGFFLAFFIYSTIIFSQRPYFQQDVSYKIDVRLDDDADVLHAVESLTYTNNSPDTLRELLFHLWPNAYRDRFTALAKQMLENGNADLFFAEKDERGWIDSLNFSIDGTVVKWGHHPEHQDICMLTLNTDLLPGATVVITTPFRVKIPDAKFSRLGHTGDAFFITQWYPKPAVYDRDGWHAMPYLDQGEFYSEIGKFEVSITLPENYVLAATGDRLDAESEEQFLRDKVLQTEKLISSNSRPEGSMEFPASSQKFKTVRFVQQNVHDFAWFTDKRFYVLNGKVLVGDGKEVQTWVYFTGKNFKYWKNALDYVNAAVSFYSKKVGVYPYKHVTAIDGTIMAGGGMEYPNITVIGDVESAFTLDMVIAHEVGHNWFYGMLANNERDHPFMDEGINSLYEIRYLRERYPEKNLSIFMGWENDFPLFGVRRLPVWNYHALSFFASARSNSDQPLNLGSHKYSDANYGSIVYSKSAVALNYLMTTVGEENFDRAMRAYFEEFKFKHPAPLDFFNALEKNTSNDFGWFKDNLYHSTNKIDYKLKKVVRKNGVYQLKIKNKTGTNVPLKISAFENDQQVFELWVLGFERSATIPVPVPHATRFELDVSADMPDLYKQNNSVYTSGIFRRRKPVRFSFLTSLEDPSVRQIFFSPVFGGNYYNGFLAGIALHNYGLLQKKWEWHIMPMYGFESRDVNGTAELNRHFFPRRTFRQITLGAKIKRYAYDRLSPEGATGFDRNYYQHYLKVSPFIDFEFRKKNERSPKVNKVSYTVNYLLVDSATIVNASEVNKFQTNSFVNTLTFHHKNTRTIDPYAVQLDVQHSTSMAKFSLAYTQKIQLTKKASVDIRIFGGSFLGGSVEERSYYAFRASGYNGWHDYLFEGNFLGRNERSGMAFSQFMVRDGGMKAWTPYGQSSTWLGGINVFSPRVLGIFRAYADVITCDPTFLKDGKPLYDLGLNLVLWENIFEVYFPVLTDDATKEGFTNNYSNWYEKFRFTFNIHKLDTKKILQSTLN